MRWYATIGAALLWLCPGGSTLAQAPRGKNERFIAAARELLGIAYQFGGWMRRPGEGIDCQGVLVGFDSNPAEPPIGKLKERPVWVWHTGIYSGGGQWSVGDHFAGQVVEVDLAKYLADHSDVYAGLVVTRMKDSPHPKQCRQHRPMPSPKASNPGKVSYEVSGSGKVVGPALEGGLPGSDSRRQLP